MILLLFQSAQKRPTPKTQSGAFKNIREDASLGESVKNTAEETIQHPTKDELAALENLIDAALVDYSISDKERNVLQNKAKAIEMNQDEFEMILNSKIDKRLKEKPIELIKQEEEEEKQRKKYLELHDSQRNENHKLIRNFIEKPELKIGRYRDYSNSKDSKWYSVFEPIQCDSDFYDSFANLLEMTLRDGEINDREMKIIEDKYKEKLSDNFEIFSMAFENFLIENDFEVEAKDNKLAQSIAEARKRKEERLEEEERKRMKEKEEMIRIAEENRKKQEEELKQRREEMKIIAEEKKAKMEEELRQKQEETKRIEEERTRSREESERYKKERDCEEGKGASRRFPAYAVVAGFMLWGIYALYVNDMPVLASILLAFPIIFLIPMFIAYNNAMEKYVDYKFGERKGLIIRCLIDIIPIIYTACFSISSFVEGCIFFAIFMLVGFLWFLGHEIYVILKLKKIGEE